MKKNLLILAGSVALCFGAAQAQQRDSTSTNRRGQQQTEQARQPRSNDQHSTATYRTGDIEILSNNDIPESLRQNLQQDEKYNGWENAVIYHNKKTGEYLVSPRAHRFNSDGQPIEQKAGSPSRMPQDNTRNRPATTGQSPQQSLSARQPMTQDTMSSQQMVSTDQGRQQSTEGRMAQDERSEKTSQGQYGNQRGQDQRKEGTPTDPQQSTSYRTDKNADISKDSSVPMEGMVEVQPTEIPVALRELLADNEYKGWESGKFYRHISTGEYMLVLDETTPGEGKKTYKFDKDGKLMKSKNP